MFAIFVHSQFGEQIFIIDEKAISQVVDILCIGFCFSNIFLSFLNFLI